LQASARAMDAIQDFIQQERGNSIEKFMIAGESKVFITLVVYI
jgi:PhoPQ-activated pathogenicity-related protein